MRIESGTFTALPRLRWLDLSHNSPFNTGERGSQVFKGLERKLSHLGMRNVSLIHVSSNNAEISKKAFEILKFVLQIPG